MIAITDVHYDEPNGRANAAALLFGYWTDEHPVATFTTQSPITAPYVAGEFWKRELEPITQVLAQIPVRLSTIIIDGYATLGRDRGLGTFLYRQFHGRVAIVGIAKNEFAEAQSHYVRRGVSKKPLFITSVGMSPEIAGTLVAAMHGDHRLPTLVQTVDHLARTA